MKQSRLLLTFFVSLFVLQGWGQVDLTFDFNRRGQLVTEDHYGIFYEEINHAGDGGLYAELIRNHSFEEDMNSPMSWSTVGSADMSLTSDNLLNTVQQRALRLNIRSAGGGVRNEGYWGINIVKGRTYTLNFWMRADSKYDGIITAELQNAGGASLGRKTIEVKATREWQKVSMEITATATANQGFFALRGSSQGVIYLDVVSLFPPTFKNRPNRESRGRRF